MVTPNYIYECISIICLTGDLLAFFQKERQVKSEVKKVSKRYFAACLIKLLIVILSSFIFFNCGTRRIYEVICGITFNI